MKKRHNDERYQEAAMAYHQQKQAFEEQKAEFEKAKAEFEELMFECCDESGNKRHKFVIEDWESNEDTLISVTKVEKTTIEWFADKLEKRVPKAIARKFVRKQYSIANWSGMVEYLKSLGAKPADFKKYIHVDKTVDEKVIDHLSDIGELTARDVAGCYLVKSQKPYFTIKVKQGNGDDE